MSEEEKLRMVSQALIETMYEFLYSKELIDNLMLEQPEELKDIFSREDLLTGINSIKITSHLC
jgi:hypothetical protein